ncbi:MAG: hypothetical protein IT518_04995 [Burkholderiales bacterium]|nr:hypothetical protein [Burkholderiales bacterium]
MTLAAAPLFLRAPRRQRGVVLFVALIAMVILSLAGVALVRAVDTSMGAAGNLAFRQSTIAPVNEAIEEAVNVIFKAKTLPATNVDNPAFNYYASLQPNESKNGVPDVLRGSYATMTAAYTGAGLTGVHNDAVSATEVRWVVERVCNMAATTKEELIEHCDLVPPKVVSAGTDNEYKKVDLPPIPIFRVTVRADIPNTNTATYAQTFVK